MLQRDAIVDAVREDLLRRSQVGIAKYGVTLERKDLSLRDWLQHAYEETLDQANYLKRAIMELDSGLPHPQEKEIIAWYAKGEKVEFIMAHFKITKKTFKKIRDRNHVPLRKDGRPRKAK